MKPTRIRIDWTATTPADHELLNGGPKSATFEDGKGWQFEGPMFPLDLEVIGILTNWLKDQWQKQRGPDR